MRREARVLGHVVFGCVVFLALDVTEIGIRVHLSRDPARSEEALDWHTALGVYFKLSMTGAWMVRAKLGRRLLKWLPRASLVTSHPLGSCGIAEVQCSIQAVLPDVMQVTVNGGGRYCLDGVGSPRAIVLSFPMAFVGLRFAYAVGWDLRWVTATNPAVTLRGLNATPAVAIGERFGLVLNASTHAGYRL